MGRRLHVNNTMVVVSFVEMKAVVVVGIAVHSWYRFSAVLFYARPQ